MKALFVELPVFERYRQDYLDDQGFRDFQNLLMENPEAGDVIEGTGGLRKIRFADAKRGKVNVADFELFIIGGQQGNNFGYLPSITKTKKMI